MCGIWICEKILKSVTNVTDFFVALMYYSECQRETIRNQSKKG